jgi:hypothetical protein
MKLVKSLVLGSAATLVALGGAQAADLPVKAKAVEYVKVCSLYGPGFYYIPGTDTCIKLGGYLRAEVGLRTNSNYSGAYSSVAGANNAYSNYYQARSREDFNIDTRTATDYGVVRTYFDAVFTWSTGSYTGTGSATGASLYSGSVGPAGGSVNGTDGNPNAGGLGVYYAFIQFAGFTMGKSVSQFDAPWSNYPANNFDGLVGGGGTTTGVNQFTYTAQLGNGVSLALSAQDQVAYYTTAAWNTSGITASGVLGGAYGSNGIGGSRSPDLVASVRVDQAWGIFQASFAAHDNHVGYYGTTELTGRPDDKWGWAAQLALQIKNIPTGAGDNVILQGVYTDGASRYNFQTLASTSYSMFGGTNLPGAYQSIGFAGVGDTVYGTGTAQSTVKTWGFRGGYTHNWNPYWNTGIYGAYAQVNYGATGSALVCAGIAATGLLTAGSTCNPNFNIGQVGLITRWTPVKNLTFSADVTYTHLDQKFSGTAAVPATLTGVAKPAAVYELKDQDTVSMLLRAQRNW